MRQHLDTIIEHGCALLGVASVYVVLRLAVLWERFPRVMYWE